MMWIPIFRASIFSAGFQFHSQQLVPFSGVISDLLQISFQARERQPKRKDQAWLACFVPAIPYNSDWHETMHKITLPFRENWRSYISRTRNFLVGRYRGSQHTIQIVRVRFPIATSRLIEATRPVVRHEGIRKSQIPFVQNITESTSIESHERNRNKLNEIVTDHKYPPVTKSSYSFLKSQFGGKAFV